MSQDLLKAVEAPENPNIPELSPGDTVNVHVRIKESGRERIQVFKGTVISVRNKGNASNWLNNSSRLSPSL